MEILLTCEHATNSIPEIFTGLFKNAAQVLESHRGWDPGALTIAGRLSADWNAPLFSYPWTRLLIEPNRSLHHPKLFSEFSGDLSDDQKNELISREYLPYRDKVKSRIRSGISGSRHILHISVHSFTPVMNGKKREVDIGLLFDPSRAREKNLCEQWKEKINKQMPELSVRFNQPYLGTDDGFITELRHTFSEDNYLGVELEINQLICQKISRSGLPCPARY